MYVRKIFDLQQKLVLRVVNINMSMSELQTLLNRYHHGPRRCSFVKYIPRDCHRKSPSSGIAILTQHEKPTHMENWIFVPSVLFNLILYFSYFYLSLYNSGIFNFMWPLKAYLFAIL